MATDDDVSSLAAMKAAIEAGSKGVMTPDEFAAAMEAIDSDGDLGQDDAHIAADELMCRLLRSLGYGAGVTIFKEMPKWYA